MDPVVAGGILKVAGGLLGRKKAPTPSQNIMSQAKGARQAAEKYGFNPLTMLQYGQPGGAMGGGGDAPPLASLAILGDIIEENYGQDAQDRREHNRLTNELLTLEVAKARTLGAVAPVSAVAGIGGGEPPPLNGGRAVQIGNVRRDPTVFGTRAGGVDIQPDEGYSDAERVEERYGDAASWAYGFGVLAADLGSTAGQFLAESDYSPFQKKRFKPDGYTEDGKPFWLTHNGYTFNKPVARDGGKDY